MLIHSACGGVGLAAIQICQVIGAEVCLSRDLLLAYSLIEFNNRNHRYSLQLAARKRYHTLWTTLVSLATAYSTREVRSFFQISYGKLTDVELTSFLTLLRVNYFMHLGNALPVEGK